MRIRLNKRKMSFKSLVRLRVLYRLESPLLKITRIGKLNWEWNTAVWNKNKTIIRVALAQVLVILPALVLKVDSNRLYKIPIRLTIQALRTSQVVETEGLRQPFLRAAPNWIVRNHRSAWLPLLVAAIIIRRVLDNFLVGWCQAPQVVILENKQFSRRTNWVTRGALTCTTGKCLIWGSKLTE